MARRNLSTLLNDRRRTCAIVALASRVRIDHDRVRCSYHTTDDGIPTKRSLGEAGDYKTTLQGLIGRAALLFTSREAYLSTSEDLTVPLSVSVI